MLQWWKQTTGRKEGVHLFSLRTDTPRTNGFSIWVKQIWVRRVLERVLHETTTTRGERGIYVMRRAICSSNGLSDLRVSVQLFLKANETGTGQEPNRNNHKRDLQGHNHCVATDSKTCSKRISYTNKVRHAIYIVAKKTEKVAFAVHYRLLWGDIGLARNMCKFQPHKPGPTQTPCAPPVRELWVACSATQELPTRPSYAPKTLEQKRKSVGTKKAVLEVLGQKKFTLDTQVTHWHTASKRCQPAWLQTYRDWRIDRWIGGR